VKPAIRGHFIPAKRGHFKSALTYGGHTLKQTLEQVARVTGTKPIQAAVDLVYRGHNYEGPCAILIANRCRESISASLERWGKRCSAVEPVIGHMKHEHGMGRNRLKGKTGDIVNAMLSACGYNLRKLLRAIARFFAPIFYWLLDLGKSPIFLPA